VSKRPASLLLKKFASAKVSINDPRRTVPKLAFMVRENLISTERYSFGSAGLLSGDSQKRNQCSGCGKMYMTLLSTS
jgi:hypothetical protein